jgi:hypothetical protein
MNQQKVAKLGPQTGAEDPDLNLFVRSGSK